WRPVVLGTLYVILFLPQLVRLVGVTWQEAKYSHGFLIPVVSAWYLYDERARVASLPRSLSVTGLLVVLLGILAWLWAQLPAQTFNALAHLSMLVVLVGMVAFSAGWRFVRGIAFPLLYLVFAFPVPKRLDDLYVVLPLQRLASVISAETLDILGIYVHRSGNILEIPGMALQVKEACSGIHSLYALVAMGTALVFGFLRLMPDRRTWEKIVLIVSTLPIAIFANVFRVTLTGILAHVFSAEVAEGFFHYFSGLLVFVLGLVIFLVFAAVLRVWFPPKLRPVAK
ncbi:MAG: exosortase/archaeosortase family protein, partial [Planctomycetota bacterium]